MPVGQHFAWYINVVSTEYSILCSVCNNSQKTFSASVQLQVYQRKYIFNTKKVKNFMPVFFPISPTDTAFAKNPIQ